MIGRQFARFSRAPVSLKKGAITALKKSGRSVWCVWNSSTTARKCGAHTSLSARQMSFPTPSGPGALRGFSLEKIDSISASVASFVTRKPDNTPPTNPQFPFRASPKTEFVEFVFRRLAQNGIAVRRIIVDTVCVCVCVCGESAQPRVVRGLLERHYSRLRDCVRERDRDIYLVNIKS